MKKLIVVATLILLTGGLVQPVRAGLTGVLTGKVTSADGTPLPGVYVVVRSPDIQGSRDQYTGETGTFRFVELPPATYSIQAELVGSTDFTPVAVEGLKVTVNRTTRQDLVLKINTELTVEVVGEKVIIDPGSATMSTTVDRDFTDRLPRSEQFQQSFAMTAGSNGAGNVRVHGGSQMDNLYLFDGVDTTDPVTSTFAANINADAIKEVEVQTAGATAEYGRFTGGLVNVITKSGGNNFNGSLRLKYVNQDWHAESKHGELGDSDVAYIDPVLTIGGPILRDKLWFFFTYRYTDVESTMSTVADSSSTAEEGPFTKVDSSSTWYYPYFKLTFSPSTHHKLVANFNADSAVIHAADADQTAAPEAQNKQEQGGPFYALEWTYIRSNNLYFVTRFGFADSYIKVIPEDEDRDSPSYADYDTGTLYGNYNRWNEEDRRRLSFQTSASKFVTNLWGDHDLKTGFEYQRLSVDDEDFYTGNAQYTLNQGGYDFLDLQVSGQELSYSGDYYALYLQDSWSLSSGLTLSPGLRYEYATFENDVGAEAGTFDTMLAPRFGLTWSLDEAAKTTLRFSAGRYYNAIDLQLPSMLNQEQQTFEHYRRPSGQPGADWEYLYSTGAQPNRLDPDLHPEYTDELTTGVDFLFKDNMALSFNGIYRATRDILEDVGIFLDEDGNEIPWDDIEDGADYSDLIYIVTNPDGAKRDYWGLEAVYRMNTEKITLLASYTYSVTKGTVIGGQPGSSGVTRFSGYYDTPSMAENLYGPLPWDSPHYVKVDTSVALPFGFSVGVKSFYRSGYAYSKRMTPPDGVYNGSQQRWYLPEGRGTYRYPDVFNTDVSLQKDFSFGKYGTLTAIADVLNVFDSQVVLQRNEIFNPNHPENFNLDNLWAAPRSYTVSLKYTL
ncbi:TonB-dependent receptor [bacterium]|nr:TonB-dependent receptor [candidate division CSSED10-310 bacterium]